MQSSAALFRISQIDCPAYILDTTFGSSMEIAAPATGIITLNGAWGQGGGGHRGIRIFDDTVTATGTQAPVDIGDPGSDGGEAYLFVTGATGSLGTATFVVQHSTSSGGTYSNLGTFSVPDAGRLQDFV